MPYFSESIDFYKKKFNLADVIKRFTPAAVYNDEHMYFYAELFGRGDDLFGKCQLDCFYLFKWPG